MPRCLLAWTRHAWLTLLLQAQPVYSSASGNEAGRLAIQPAHTFLCGCGRHFPHTSLPQTLHVCSSVLQRLFYNHLLPNAPMFVSIQKTHVLHETTWPTCLVSAHKTERRATFSGLNYPNRASSFSLHSFSLHTCCAASGTCFYPNISCATRNIQSFLPCRRAQKCMRTQWH